MGNFGLVDIANRVCLRIREPSKCVYACARFPFSFSFCRPKRIPPTTDTPVRPKSVPCAAHVLSPATSQLVLLVAGFSILGACTGSISVLLPCWGWLGNQFQQPRECEKLGIPKWISVFRLVSLQKPLVSKVATENTHRVEGFPFRPRLLTWLFLSKSLRVLEDDTTSALQGSRRRQPSPR